MKNINTLKNKRAERIRRLRKFFRHRQHPMKIITYTKKTAWLLIIPVTKYLVAASFDFQSWLRSNWLDILVISVIIGYAFLRWIFVYFDVDSESITAHTGYFGLATTRVMFKDISSATFVQGTVARFFNACTVYIDTSAKSIQKSEIKITLTKRRADQINGMIATVNSKAVKYTCESNRRYMLAFSLLFSSTFSGVLIFAGLAFESAKLVGQNIEQRLLQTVNGEISKVTSSIPQIIVITILVVIGGWLMSFLSNLMRYWKFSSTRYEDKLLINSGIWTIRNHVLFRNRINYVDIKQSLLMKLVKICGVNVSCAGYGKLKSEIPAIIPITTISDVDSSVKLLLPDYHSCEAQLETGKKQIRFFLLIPFIIFIAVQVARFVFVQIFPIWSREITILTLISIIPFVWLMIVKIISAFHTGIGFKDGYCTMAYCKLYGFHKVTTPIGNITKVSVKQTWMQQKSGYCSLQICTTSENTQKHLVKYLPCDAVTSLLRTNGFNI